MTNSKKSWCNRYFSAASAAVWFCIGHVCLAYNFQFSLWWVGMHWLNLSKSSCHVSRHESCHGTRPHRIQYVHVHWRVTVQIPFPLSAHTCYIFKVYWKSSLAGTSTRLSDPQRPRQSPACQGIKHTHTCSPETRSSWVKTQSLNVENVNPPPDQHRGLSSQKHFSLVDLWFACINSNVFCKT